MEKVVTNSNLEEILSSSNVVMIDFWASWCGPCRMLGPTVEEVASLYDGRATVAKCNVDDADEVAAKFGIRNIPTLIYFKDKEVAGRSVGLVSKAEIASKLDSLL